MKFQAADYKLTTFLHFVNFNIHSALLLFITHEFHFVNTFKKDTICHKPFEVF